MSLLEIIFLGMTLSFDTLAFVICQSLTIRKMSMSKVLLVGLLFFVFCIIMSFIGYFLAYRVNDYLININRLLSFGILSIIGIKIIKDSIKETSSDVSIENVKDFIPIAFLTSIDSFFMGMNTAFINSNIIIVSMTLGVMSIMAYGIGILIGLKIKNIFDSKIAILGGLFMILLGLKMLII